MSHAKVKLFLGEETSYNIRTFYHSRLAWDSMDRRHLIDRLLKLLEHGVGNFGARILVGRTLLIDQRSDPLDIPVITPRELIGSLFEREISPRLLNQALIALENTLIPSYVEGKRIEVRLDALSTPKLSQKGISQRDIGVFYAADQPAKLNFLVRIGVLVTEPLTVKTANTGKHGQLGLIPNVPISWQK
jgi:hypothetical protein